MRYLRVGGIVVSLGTLLAGMALQMDQIVRASLFICFGAMAICFADKPAERASLIAPAACLLCSALALLANQTGDPFFAVPTGAGDQIVHAGESAYRTLGACLLGLLAGAWLGQTLLEGLLGKAAFGSRAGWAGAPVRICALLCMLVGMAACLVPGLSEWLIVPASVQTVTALFTTLATAGAACYIASARSRIASCIVLLLYLACAVFDPALFAEHLFFAAACSVLLCAKGDGRASLLCLAPVPAVCAALWLYKAEGSALGLYAGRLWQAAIDYAQPGGLEWILRVYARFGIYGYIAAGLAAGAFLFLLGRLLRDSFLYSAPVLYGLACGCVVLFKGTGCMPAVPDLVFFFAVYGLCLIVGCVRRASRKGKR